MRTSVDISLLPVSGYESDITMGPDDQRFGLVELFVVAAGSLLAVPGVFAGMFINRTSFLGPIVAGPLMEEILKPAGIVILLTRRPYLKLKGIVGILAGAFSGLTFAAIENLIYLEIYVPEHDRRYVVWRWTVCVGVHVICSAVVGYGLARGSGLRAARDAEEFRLLPAHLLDQPRERSGVFQGPSFICLLIAVVLHGAYNLAAFLLPFGHFAAGIEP
ncbi:MAG: PrsW family glutamic-type intramembrane protease [Pirellulaceae bacterium]